jgi:rhodanese-related sulfurtransferase
MAKSLDDFVNEALQWVEEISVEESARILSQSGCEGWVFVDVREADEFATGRVPGARHSPRGFLEVHADLFHPKRDPWFTDRDRPMIVYCGGGNRSALAARALGEMGFTRVVSLAGGFAKWRDQGRPIET